MSQHTARLVAIVVILAGVVVGLAAAPDSLVFVAPIAGALLLLPLVPSMTTPHRRH